MSALTFLTYTAAVVLVVRKHGFNVHAYADDLQIYDHTVPSGMAGLLQRMAVRMGGCLHLDVLELTMPQSLKD